MERQRIVVIVGPTASGKSAYAVRLAKKVRGEVISADSRQVYKGLDIGTGKITKKEMSGVPHHLLDVCSPKKVFSAHNYVEMARPILEDILARGKTPIICGGTGFYIDALLDRVTLPNVSPNEKLRSTLRRKSTEQLFRMVRNMDPVRAATIDRHNPVRLIRAIEIATKLGSVPQQQRSHFDHQIEWIGINPSDSVLRKKIHARLLSRMKQGMVAEAKRLHAQGLSYKRMTELGLEYRHLALLLKGEVDRITMLSKLERDIWHYVKRQRTYWRRNPDIRWI